MTETAQTKKPARSAQGTGAKLTPQAQELLQERTNGLPIWIRAPKVGTEFYTGLSRSKLYQLAGDGKIRSHSLREPGQIKGTRIFNLKSILDFFDRLGQDAANMAGQPGNGERVSC